MIKMRQFAERKVVVGRGKARNEMTEKSSDLLREIWQSVQVILKKTLT